MGNNCNCPFCGSKELESEKCTCGSGAHPRNCDRHPWGYKVHANEMDLENRSEWYCEAMDMMIKTEELINRYKKKLDSLEPDSEIIDDYREIISELGQIIK